MSLTIIIIISLRTMSVSEHIGQRTRKIEHIRFCRSPLAAMHIPSCQSNQRERAPAEASLFSDEGSPIPRIQRGPLIEASFKSPDKRHEITIRLSLQARPARVPQAVARITRDEHLPSHRELIRMAGVEVYARDEIGQVARHSRKVK